MKAALPANESGRLSSLALYEILDALPDAVFDEITHLAAHICGCPIATISIIDETRQWYKSRVGISQPDTPRDISFCAHTILGDGPLIVEDTTKDERFFDNPVVMQNPGVRFYAGIPLTNPEGFALGTLCVADLKPRQLSDEQSQALQALSRHVMTHLELRRALIERNRAQEEIHRLNEQLEKRVGERTSQLNFAYQSLKDQMEESERLQRMMVQIQKMEAIGRLAGGIAHDFNNILLVITGYCDLTLSAPGAAKNPGLEYLREIQKAGQRGAALTRQLLAFSRRQIIEPRVFDLNQTVDAMHGMLMRLIGADIRVEIRKGRDLDPIRADISQIEQVIMNLVINAVDAMPQGGRLTLETNSLHLEAPHAYEGGTIEPNRYTVLSVQDSGTGITEEVRARLFEPFFTTKPEGKGTGLGLATCYGVAKQNGGYITCKSEVGTGTTFRVYLPVSQMASGRPETRRIPLPPQAGRETILLVEDDSAVRKLTALMLDGLGYTVLEAEDGIEALALMESRSSMRIDLLVTDMMMPNLGGRELAERAVGHRPELKCLLVSGHSDDALVQRGVLQAHMHFLQKPYSPPQLAKAVRDALENRETGSR